jgi:Fe-S-cluster containining protein
MEAPELKPEERSSLERLAGEICATVRERGAAKTVLLERLSTDFEAAGQMQDAITGALAKRAVRAACGPGCSYCCHLMVYVSEIEAFFLADYIERSPRAAELRRRVMAAAPAASGLTESERFRNKLPCPLLDRQSGTCMAYEARPFACRGCNSVSWVSCKKAFRSAAPETRVPYIKPLLNVGVVAREGYIDGLRRAGIKAKGVELIAGLAAIFSTENAFERWIAGENIFDGQVGGSVDQTRSRPQAGRGRRATALAIPSPVNGG